MSYIERKNTYIEFINASLRGYLRHNYPEVLFDAMNYAVFSGGKRLRPILFLSICEMLGGTLDEALPFSSALELIHTSSLVHDDLPALDDDDFRRGKPTCHKRYGEGVAILCGDALLNMAYEVMTKQSIKLNKTQAIESMHEIAVSSGCRGMLAGQTVDLISENKKIDDATSLYIMKNKTGKLIKASMVAGAKLAGAKPEMINKIADVGNKLGIAFQIKDDILDVEGDQKLLGKPLNSDRKNNKQTYVSIYGIEKAKNDYSELSNSVLDIILSIGENYQKEFVLPLIEDVLSRNY